jgi:pimeloyl-ACP methyl ester carboxylesterase
MRALYDAGPDAVPDLGRIEVPAVVVIGAEDAITPPDVCQVVVDGLPNATAETVPGMGHFPTVTRPDTLVEVISARFG